MAADQLSKLNPDGTKLGQSTADLIAFYGLTAVDQPASPSAVYGTSLSVVYLTVSGVYGFSTLTAFSAAVSMLNAIYARGVELGLWAA